MKLLYKGAIACFAMFCLTLGAEEHWQSKAFIKQSFVEIALRNEFSPQPSLLRKWVKPIRVWVLHKVGDQALHQSLLDMHLAHLSQLMQLPITIVNQEADADIKVIFSQQDDFRQDIVRYLGPMSATHIYATVCIANIMTNQKHEITKAAIIIPVDQAIMHRKLVSCIVEELTQVMGLPNDSEKVYPSIFNDKTPDDLLTGLDGLLIKLLYHPSMKVGMTEAQVQPVLEKLIEAWRLDGTIANAHLWVKQGGLYQEMGF